ncbi:MAG: hypothetical protein U0R44_06905 [Candidatus Micrarchaeia archaeon]
MTIGDSLLERIKQGDAGAVAHFKDILKVEGVIEMDEISRLQLAAVSAALAQTGKGKGAADAKLDIYFNVFDKLAGLRTAGLTEGSADLKAAAAKLMAETPEETGRVWTYDKLMMLALSGPQTDQEGLDQRKKRMLELLESNNYSPVIQIGALLARSSRGESRPDDDLVRLSNACLRNAALHGKDDSAWYALEALSAHGDRESRETAKDRLLTILSEGNPEERKAAFGILLEAFSGDGFVSLCVYQICKENAQIRSELADIAKNGKPEIAAAAGSLMAGVRIDDEKETAVADFEFLLETEYIDPTSPQRMYVEFIFDAVKTVYGPLPLTKRQSDDLEIAVKQLSAHGANPGQIEAIFESKSDQFNLRKVMKSVENALLHAFANNGGSVRELAASGLERIGSERVQTVLERIVARNKNELGSKADDLLADIRGREVWDTVVVVPSSRRALERAKPPAAGRIVQ